MIAGPSLHVQTRGRAIYSRERRGEVEIVRTWGTRFSKKRLAGRLVNLATYYLLAAAAGLRVEHPDVIVAATDPPLLGALGAALKRRYRCRLVYNVRDLYPDIARANGGLENPALLALLARSNESAYRSADAVVTLGHDMAERIVAHGVPPAKVIVIPDWVDTREIRPLDSNPFRAQFGDRFVVMYSGNIGLSQQLESVLDAAERIRSLNRAIVFVLIGEGARKSALMKIASDRGLENVMFLPYRPKEKLAESLSAADLHLIPLMPGAAGCLVPSKVYGILAAARPYIAMMEPHAEVARIAHDYRAGFVVPPGDSRALAETIIRAAAKPAELKAMGLRAREAAVAHYDRAKITAKFSALLSRVAGLD